MAMGSKITGFKKMNRQTGFTVAELMVGMTIGLIVLSGVSSAYISSRKAGGESQAASEQVENGRQALEFISYDLRHAGYFGQMSSLPAPAAALPDPCETSDLVALRGFGGVPEFSRLPGWRQFAWLKRRLLGKRELTAIGKKPSTTLLSQMRLGNLIVAQLRADDAWASDTMARCK